LPVIDASKEPYTGQHCQIKHLVRSTHTFQVPSGESHKSWLLA
jgi:hypothetical protein